MSKTLDRPAHRGLRHVALKARDLPAMRRFYVDLLGFAVEWEPDADNVYLSSGVDNLALHRDRPANEAHSPAPRGGPLDHIGLIVATPADVDRWAAFLE